MCGPQKARLDPGRNASVAWLRDDDRLQLLNQFLFIDQLPAGNDILQFHLVLLYEL